MFTKKLLANDKFNWHVQVNHDSFIKEELCLSSDLSLQVPITRGDKSFKGNRPRQSARADTLHC